MSRIFINYRRSLSEHAALRLRDLLARHFGRSIIFFDEHAIDKGADFPAAIGAALQRCEVFLPLIGPGWHQVAEAGRPRLMQDDDWVRREIRTVLERNTTARASHHDAVLVLPLLLDGATLPPADALPDDLLPLLNVNAMAFRSERDLEALVSVIDARLGDPPMGALGVRLMASRPDLSKASDYRFRAPTAPAELAPFVALSDEEPDIALSNPTLTGESRLGLYDRWCQWTAEDEARPWSAPGNRTRSFLILDQRQADGAWRSIAVSIVLPLSMRGGATLMGTSMEAAREPAAKRTAVTLEADDLSHTGSSCLLIDTWAVARRQSDGVGAVRRVNHHAWAIAMLLRHIAEFWSPTSPAPVTFMVEPNERVARVLFSLGFERRDRNALSGDLYFLEYPLNAYRYAPEARQAIEQILEAMRAAARFPVERSGDGI